MASDALEATDNGDGPSLPQVTAALERRLIIDALVRSDHNLIAAAKRLGVSRRTLYYKLKRLGLDQLRGRGSNARG